MQYFQIFNWNSLFFSVTRHIIKMAIGLNILLWGIAALLIVYETTVIARVSNFIFYVSYITYKNIWIITHIETINHSCRYNRLLKLEVVWRYFNQTWCSWWFNFTVLTEWIWWTAREFRGFQNSLHCSRSGIFTWGQY